MRPNARGRAALVLALAAMPSPAAHAQAFEGVIVSIVRHEDENKTYELTMSIKGNRARLESPVMEGAYSLLDVSTQSFTMVMAAQRKYMKFEAGDDKDDKATRESIKSLGKTETIAGYPCTHYLFEIDDETYDICAATGIGFSAMGGQPGSGGRGTLPRDFQKTFKDGFQPLKVERVKGNQRDQLILVKSVTRKALAASLFEIPAGFQEVEMGVPGKPPS